MAVGNYFEHYLTHAGIDWTTNVRNYGYPGSSIGENIAAGAASAQETFVQWKNSPPHDANVLNSTFKAIGIGRAFSRSSNFNWCWTTDFGNTVDASAPGCSSDPDYVPASRSSSNYCADAEETALLDAINGYRSNQGLPTLAMDHRLDAAADFHAANMASSGSVSVNLTNGT